MASLTDGDVVTMHRVPRVGRSALPLVVDTVRSRPPAAPMEVSAELLGQSDDDALRAT